MHITVNGSGNMGRAIATRAAAAGHTTLQIVGRDPVRAQALAAELGGDVTAGSLDDSPTAKVTELAASMGLRPLDAGPLRRSRELEALGFLQMAMQGALGNTWSTTFKVLGA
ncbi:NAD(P)-binding domain-containing protein [Georgenia yuyongxinii]|uniref:Pyrroline-5-carboxylate reductase catalytic N-terminal domain-containing protein n=1 Tax=Georgenia yuyongxinii TaxID=2589797 RepID=A0A552WU60_9MICO|nr:NAD(P)-binding domain-containing protein [Georgenia yuyongxinii]TRW46304.1 hypothetical protein FJ693_06085 [Georgenia yuyongxinii]